MRLLAALLLAVAAATVGGDVAVAGCSPNREWQDAGPRWSPDGARIAFYRVLQGCDPAPVGIYVVPSRGGDARLLGLAAGQWPASWSPDGRLLAFGGRSGLVVVQVVGSGLDEVTTDRGFAPAWSPDGAWIAYRRGVTRGELWLVRPDGSDRRPLASGLHDTTLPVWSPDSREVAFAGYVNGSFDVEVADVSTGSLRVVAPSPAFDLEPAWSRDGSTIAFTSYRDGAAPVYAVTRDGSNVRRWTDGQDPAFAAGGDALAYRRPVGVWYETGTVPPTRAVARDDVLGRVDWRPQRPEAPAFAFSAGGSCGRHGIYVRVGRHERRLTNPCVFRGRGLVRGTPNRDRLYGSRRADRFLAFAGNDVIHARDGRRDTVDCGPGRDTVYADRVDALRGCEVVRR